MAMEEVRNVPLPSFSEEVTGVLKRESLIPMAVWKRLVHEAGVFYLKVFPNLRHTSTYQRIGLKVFQEYPSIGTYLSSPGGAVGPKPWSRFIKSLSQKIRHLRHDSLKAQRSFAQQAFDATPLQSSVLTGLPQGLGGSQEDDL